MAQLRVTQETGQRATVAQRVTPKLVTAGTVLQMSSGELQLRIEEESAVNPALEIIRDSVCPTCGRELSRGACPFCMLSSREVAALEAEQTVFATPFPRFPGSNGDEHSHYDPIENTPQPPTLKEYVLQQARLILPSACFFIAEHLVSELSDEGILETPPEEIADMLGLPRKRVLDILHQLQTLDPPGICARSVQECTQIQLSELATQAEVPRLADAILSQHWLDLANHAYEKIERRLNADRDEVEAAVTFIRQKLHPYPGRLYRSPYPSRDQGARDFVRPDVIIRRDAADYPVEVVRPFDFELRVSAAYQRLAAAGRRSDTATPEYLLALEQCRRATWLVQSVALREQTLRQIAECITVCQRPFLDTGSEEKMKRLSRTEVAKKIGKHPSTVSRAVAGKFVLLPSGNLVPFEKFFSPALAPKTVIADLLAKESPERPLTDDQICRILRARGFQVARRTVAKYRLGMRLPSSAQRGRH